MTAETYVEAPRMWNGDGPSVFLAGGITGCPDWQSGARHMLEAEAVTILNPRRSDFPIHDPTAAAAQIAWEFDHLHRASVILFWFPVSEGPQPIALYELGRYVALGRPVVVGCDPRFPRAQDVHEQMKLAVPGMPIYASLGDVCAAARLMLAVGERQAAEGEP